jgi:hypothetical protein
LCNLRPLWHIHVLAHVALGMPLRRTTSLTDSETEPEPEDCPNVSTKRSRGPSAPAGKSGHCRKTRKYKQACELQLHCKQTDLRNGQQFPDLSWFYACDGAIVKDVAITPPKVKPLQPVMNILSVFDGSARLPQAFAARGCGHKVVEIKHQGISGDMTQPAVVDRIIAEVERGDFNYGHVHFPCNTHSSARSPKLRSRKHPDGIPGI